MAHYADVTGEILVTNSTGTMNSLVDYRHCMAFVPQDDIMYDALSVEDNIKYAAVLFNRRGFT